MCVSEDFRAVEEKTYTIHCRGPTSKKPDENSASLDAAILFCNWATRRRTQTRLDVIFPSSCYQYLHTHQMRNQPTIHLPRELETFFTCVNSFNVTVLWSRIWFKTWNDRLSCEVMFGQWLWLLQMWHLLLNETESTLFISLIF